GAELNLVNACTRSRRDEHLLELVDVEVRDADRTGVALLARSLHSRPRPGGAALGPMDDVKVDVIDAEAPKALLGLLRRIVAAGIELRGKEQILARDAAVSDCLADALLVAIGLRR